MRDMKVKGCDVYVDFVGFFKSVEIFIKINVVLWNGIYYE